MFWIGLRGKNLCFVVNSGWRKGGTSMNGRVLNNFVLVCDEKDKFLV